APIPYSQASGWISKGFVLSGYANCAAPTSAFFRAWKLSMASAPQVNVFFRAQDRVTVWRFSRI
ncbi:Uncharacterized protein APZ42_007176, partial [Daphnia magna]